MSVFDDYRVGDRVVMRSGVSSADWKGVVTSIARGPGGGPKHCWVEWTGTNDDGTAWVDDMGMEFFEIMLDPDFPLDVPADRSVETVERWLAS